MTKEQVANLKSKEEHAQQRAERDAAIVQYYNFGFNYKQIAKLMNCDYDVVRAAVATSKGTSTPRQAQRESEKAKNTEKRRVRDAEILRLISEGVKYKEISERLGCSLQTVCRAKQLADLRKE